MKAYFARLTLAEHVKRFADIASRQPYEIDVRGGRHVVDGKSIPGLLSLDLSKRLFVEAFSDDCSDMEREMAPFLVG